MIKVVLVDDNKSVIDSYVDYINTIDNIEVVGIAKNGKEAISILKEKEVSVVVLDIIMPEMDGIGVMKFINQMKKRPKVIVTSVIKKDVIVKKFLDLKVIYYMIKPFTVESLINRIQDIEDTSLYQKLIEKEVEKIFQKIDIPRNLKGTNYIKDSIVIVASDDKYNKNMGGIYQLLAQKYQVSEKSIEKAIRNAVDITFERGNTKFLTELFKTQISIFNGKVSNKAFIFHIAKEIDSHIKETNS